MKLEYYEWWDSLLKKSEFPLDESEAKKFHEKEKPYVVIISDKKPRFIVNVHFNYEGYFCRFDYLNENLDIERSESYVVHNQQLFLKNVKEWYRDGREISLVSYLYETDGRYRKRTDFTDGRQDLEYGNCDVSSHFREMIRFGNYDSILPEEAKRGLREG